MNQTLVEPLPAVSTFNPEVKLEWMFAEEKIFSRAQIAPKKDNWDFDGLQISQRQYNVHSFHHYTAKFIPQIPQNILNLFGKPGAIVLDPFLGSGTTCVEAKLQNYVSFGIEINPLAVKIAKAKVTPVDYDALREVIKWLYEKSRKNEKNQPDVEVFKDSSLWFRRDVRHAIHEIIAKTAGLDTSTKNLIEIALSHHLKGASNARMDRTMPTLPESDAYVDRKHYDRPVDNTTRHINLYARVFSKLTRMERALKYMEHISGKTPANIIQGDSRNLADYLNLANIVVTSPPYWDAQNYQELHMLSFKALGLKEPKLGEIGRNKAAYLSDMEQVIEQLAQIVKGKFAFVIGEDPNGDSMHEKLYDIILSHGFKPFKSIRRKLSNQVGFTKSIHHEYIYIFEK